MNKIKLIAAAAAFVACGSTLAATPIGTLAPNMPLAYAGTMSGDFMHELSFTVLNGGVNFSGIVSSSFSGKGLIKDFAATLTGPNGYAASWDYSTTASPLPTYQLLTDSEATLGAGDYLLSISGKALRFDSYTVDMSLSPIPEPETYALMLAGLLAVGFIASRRRAE